MMINITALENDLYTPLNDYLTLKKNEGVISAVPDIWEVEQMFEASEKALSWPRVSYKVSLPYEIDNRAATVEKEVVPSNEDNFEEDIEYVYIINPQITISFNGYGSIKKPVRKPLLLIREWFEIEQLAGRWFQQYNGVIVRNQLGNVQDRTTGLEVDREQRLGFDAVIKFEDKIKVREKTIEELELTQNGNTETLDT